MSEDCRVGTAEHGRTEYVQGETKSMAEGGGISRTGAVFGEFALVEEGDGEERCSEDEKRKDAIGAIEEGKVIEEDFQDDHAEKKESLPAKDGELPHGAEEEENGGISGPEDGNRKVLRK